MNGIARAGICALVFILAGLTWRVRRDGEGSVLWQFFGGLNVFVSLILAWMTAVFLFGSFHNELVSGQFFVWGSAIGALVLCAIWVVRGLVPRYVGDAGRAAFGHLMLAIATVVHGSVTFYLPVVIWLGLIDASSAAVVPWLALITLPIACLCWAVGLAMIRDSEASKRRPVSKVH